jgi:membrane-associated protein
VHPVAVNILSASSLIAAFGVAGVLVVLFAETGLLVGFFLPGDTMLFVAGFAASGNGLRVSGTQVHLPLGWLLLAAIVGALAGAQTGYLIGRRYGPPLFARPDSRLFKRRYVDRTRYYFDRFGPGKAVVVARFIPVVRTFLNPLAGTVGMPNRDFAIWNVVGGIGWTVGVILLGFFLHGVDVIRHHLELLIVAVAVISIVPIVVEAARERKSRPAAGTGS